MKNEFTAFYASRSGVASYGRVRQGAVWQCEARRGTVYDRYLR